MSTSQLKRAEIAITQINKMDTSEPTATIAEALKEIVDTLRSFDVRLTALEKKAVAE